MRRQTVSACALVALLVASTVAATVPVAATTAPQPSQASATAAGADHLSDRQFNNTVFLAVETAANGDVVVGGQSVTTGPNGTFARNVNGTVSRIGADGSTEWTTRVESRNATRVVDLVVADDDSIYALITERPADPRAGYRAGELDLARLTADGQLTWRTGLNGTNGYAVGASLVDSDDGVVVSYQSPEGEGVVLAEYAGGDTVWERTYGVDARVSSLRSTDDGFLLAGTVDFDEPWLLRTTESGRPTFNESYPGLESAGLLGAVPTDDGGVLVAGRHRPGFGTTSSAWVAGIDAGGDIGWTRVHGVGADVQVNRVFDADEGLVLVGQDYGSFRESGSVRLVGVGTDGARLFDERVAGVPRITALTRSGDTLTAAGIESFSLRGFNATFAHLSVPDADPEADATLDPDVGLTSGETVYRGQNARIAESGPSETFELVRLPGEYGEFDPHVVRRFTTGDDGEVVVESATLPDGEYALRGEDGEFVAVEDGRVGRAVDREEATFRVEAQRFFRVETNRTYVDVASGERGVSLTFDSERADYDVHVRADRFEGGTASADDLRAVFGDLDGFEGIETVEGQPAARIHVGERPRLNVSVASLDAGLYDLTVSGVDTRDGGAVADGRVVVGTERARPLGLELENRSLTVPAGASASTNVTLTNVSHGIAALSMSANRTGEPTIRLGLRADIDASRASSSSFLSDERSGTETEHFQGNTGNGTVRVGQFEVDARGFGREPISNGTNTVTFRVDWVVDENGVPYTVPESTTITVTVTDAGNATGDARGGSGATGTGTEGGSGSAGGSTSSSGGSS